jgi:hypothetical protein
MIRSSRLLRLTTFFTFLLLSEALLSSGQGGFFSSARGEEHPSPRYEPDWSENFKLPATPRVNPYELSPDEWKRERAAGLQHALEYPIPVSGVLIPWRPLKSFLELPQITPLHSLFQSLFKNTTGVRSLDDLYERIGLHSYPKSQQAYPFEIPAPNHSEESRLGVTLQKKGRVDVLTFGCATCHSTNLFGRRIIGLSNRNPRPYEFSLLAKKMLKLAPPELFAASLLATPEETAIYASTRERLLSVGLKMPQALGLDTSVSAVGLSLDRRNGDPDATLNLDQASHPRPDFLTDHAADAKPGVWWNARYKTRWLADGSMISGNPVITNVLWNEIGRGTDLKELRVWLRENEEKMRALTVSVFASEAPLYTDFFPVKSIRISSAMKGEALFQANCASCHGQYEKAWSRADAKSLPLIERLKTTAVKYPSVTPVVDVGTDPSRREGTDSVADRLNRLNISKDFNIVIERQKGYVPQPLVGIWARWPYFHNNSAPSLCAVLSVSAARPKFYYSGEALDPVTDFDTECNGYPLGDRTPEAWKNSAHRYDTKKDGLSNRGHDEGILIRNGKEIFTREDKRDLIQFLKTL